MPNYGLKIQKVIISTREYRKSDEFSDEEESDDSEEEFENLQQ